ncbi:cyclic nucleotide-binding and patatin-like phospholipase domain-containing protein [Legionella anisa]|uniref:Cyclic nucleotide-binding protein n=1 Tax=Legionella anisa TaxID=28082 RepID=A0AAX0WVP9_9GAMM|nr:cyclic nucleotide-binding and patatin-like phospholipase domain-containing protein [Legionella anisa]AWN73614.1 cyclic nucleotide-binding protein [Legionella anisa]KTC75728.1 patatin-like phospholipase [Legionella anisa]MCW8426505.1 patatin-like phospholipase domain-containing protein [Legionella anisa]MCW8448168.1 patatin-like phospholipase domain-containing protein [Legionella anisa]PNL62474.1 cyclic nucleotide-binding protein [Legionella anisa]
MDKPLLTPQEIFEFIKQHEPFRLMSDACLAKLSRVLEIESRTSDSLLIKKGETMNDLYILIKGRLYYQITDIEGNITFQGELHEGSIIGEMALISDLPRSANVYTLRDCIILKLSKKNFLKLCRTFPELLNKITQFTIQRLTNSLQGIHGPATRDKSVALIPIRPIQNLEFQLQEMIFRFSYGEKILLLNSSYLENRKNLLDVNGNMSNEGILWINQLEKEYSYIFYLADETITSWTKFCVRQADSLAFLALAEEHDPALSEVENYILTMQSNFIKRNVLVLVHQTANPPKNTQSWLEKRSVNSHFHVRNNTEEGISRMMRIFTDNTISLVLSGGGARGLAHIGVYRLLEERGIPIDYIAGTSMGAMLAAAFAMGYSSSDVLKYVEEHLIKGAKIDFTFPYIAIATGKRATDSLIELYGENSQIEDLWLNYFCVSTDLISKNLYVHDRGRLWESIRSSISLPFIYPPVSFNDKLLIDGGILNNIPTNVMRQYSHSSKIIASNISINNVFKLTPIPYSLSGWKLLYNKFMGKESILPINLGELVLRLLTISSHQNTSKMMAMADYGITLKIDQYGILDFKKYKEIAETGYEQAKAQFTAQNLAELLKNTPQHNADELI